MEEAPRRLWAKILGEEPLFSCLGLSFEDRFGNVCTRVAGAIAPAAGGRRVFSLVRARVPQPQRRRAADRVSGGALPLTRAAHRIVRIRGIPGTQGPSHTSSHRTRATSCLATHIVT